MHELWMCRLRLVRWLHVLYFCLNLLWMSDGRRDGMEALFEKPALAGHGT